jgi:ornithine carbamoyltransferase
MSPIRSSKRDLKTAADLSREDIEAILARSRELKSGLERGERPQLLAGKMLAMIFEKPSLRTRCTFEIGIVQLGGHAVHLAQTEIGLGQRESIKDIAHNIERWFDLVMARTFSQATVNELARHCRLPVINALSDQAHPCQALADLLTLTEHAGDLKGFNLTYIGDGNNICHSLMQIGTALGLNVTVCTPQGYEPEEAVAQRSCAVARSHGGSFQLQSDPAIAVARAQAIYTDVWASMGQEDEALQRAEVFQPYQVNTKLVAAAPEGVLIMHDLPAHRGEEITDEVIDGPGSIVFDQAENRLHAQKGLMVFLDEACQ